MSGEAFAPPAPRWTWGIALASAACTLSLFLAVPLLETLRHVQQDPEAEWREMPLLPAPPPPPPALLDAPPPPPESSDASPAPAQIPLPAAPAPLPISASLSLPALLTPPAWSIDPLQLPALPPPPPTLFDIGEIDEPPRPRIQTAPLYPPRARMNRIEGWVDLEFTVTASGEVLEARVLDAAPDDTFVRATLQAAQRWRFHPGRHEGREVSVRVRQRITFELER